MAIDPDRLLQRVIDAINVEMRRLRSWQRQGVSCDECGQKAGLQEFQTKFLIDAGKLLVNIAFGARKLIAAKLLQNMSEGQLEAFEKGAQTEGKSWLPEV